MNKFYKVVFCKTTGVMKAVSETAKSGKKTKSISIAAGVLSAGVVFSTAALAATGDPVVAGDAVGLNALAVGETNTVDGNRSTAIGSDNGVSGESNTALGVNNNIRPTEDYLYNGDGDGMEILLTPSIRSTAIGVENTIEGNESVANGVFNKAKANNVTITGGRNEVSSKESGTYGQGNYVGKDMVAPALARVRVDDGYRIGYRGYIAEGSYAYGNSNQVIGDKSHAVGNSNNVSGDKNGLLGNGNSLSTEKYEQPRRMATARMAVGDGELSRAIMPVSDGEPSRIRLDGRDEGSFLVGNENEVNGINTHAVGNQNQIYNDDNVTLGSGNRVEFYQADYIHQPVEATRLRDDSNRIMLGRNTSTAIVGANNRLEAAGVHIVGTENNIQQAYSYVVGAGNTIELPFNAPMSGMMGNSPVSGTVGSELGSNVFGSSNYTESEKSLIVGDRNRIDQNSFLAVVTGSENNINGTSSSTVGNSNQIQKDVGGAHGTMNRVRGNTGALQAINAAYDAYNSGEAEVFEGLDLDGDGVVDFATIEEFMLMVNQSGSYAYGNINNIQGEGIHTVGNNNEFSGNNNKGVGNNNRIGQVGGMVGNSDAVLPTVKFYDSAAYGDLNIVNANSAQAIGNKNSLEKDFSSITGYNNTVTQGLNGELVDVTIEQQQIAGTFVSGNNNSVESHGGHVSGSGNDLQADNATLSGNENIVIGDGGHVVGNENEVYGNGNNGFGNNNVIGKVMNGDHSSVDSSHIVGNNNTVEGNLSSAFGNKNTVSGDETSVIGLSNTTDGEGSLILGNYNENQSSMTTMIGGYNTIDNDYSDNSVAVGHNNRLSGNQATTIGNNNSIEKDASGAIGVKNYIADGFDRNGLAGEGLAGMGDGIDYDKYIERGSYAQGNKNDVRGDTTHVYGYQNGVLGNKASVMGANNSVSGNGTQVIGNDNTIGYNNDGMPQYGDNIAVLGSNNTVEAENSFVVGNNSTVDRGADGSLVFGSNASSSVAGGVAIGNNSVADRENAVSVGSAGAERQITNVADATETKDAVNLGQLNASLRDTTSGKNVTATRTDTGYEVALNDAITLDSVTTGSTVVDTNGVKVGDVTVSNVGLDNAGNRVTSVGDATLRSDAVNYGQFTDGLAGTIKSVTGDENIIATTDAEKNVSLVLNKDLVADSLTAGDTVINNAGFTNGATTLGNTGLKVGDVTVSSAGLDNAGNRVTNVGDAIENSDAVNYGQFKAGLTDTTAGKNIAVKRTDTGYEVSTVDDITLTSMTAGDTLINNAGFTNGATTLGNTGLKVGDVTVGSVGLDNAGNRVTSVGDATLRSDAVNYGQFTDGLAGTIKSVTGDENITATTDAEKNVSLVLKKDITVDSMTAGNTVINDAGFTNGATTLGNTGLKVGDVTVSSAGLDNAGNRVTSVGNAIEDTDAVNYGQFKAGLTDTTAGKNIAVKRTDTGYEVSTVEDMTLTSVKTGDTLINNAGFTNGATTVGGAGLKVGDVTVSNVGLDNAGNRVTSVGDATLRSDAVNYGQFTDGLAGTIKSVTGDENITATTDAEKNVIVSLNKNANLDSVTAGNTLINNAGFTNGATTLGDTGLKVGDVTVSTTGLDNAGNRVTSVGDAVNRTDAVNYGQYLDGIKDLTAPDNYFHTNATGSAQTGNATNLDSINGIGGAKGAGSIAIGMNAQATGTNAVAIGNNLAEGNNALVSGGSNNEALGAFSSVASGRDNVALSDYAVVLGGVGNVAGSLETDEFETRYGQYSVIAGGLNNTTAGSKSVISGGEGNTANGNFSSIGGGGNNVANDQFGTIAGGQNNTTTGTHNFIGGGQNNNANSFNSSIVGGMGNSINDASRGFIGGGQNNEIHRSASVIGGGQDNSSFATHSTIGGGFHNIVEETGAFSVIAGGYDNRTRGQDAVVSGGRANAANGAQSVVAGGRNNIANAQHSTVSGGTLNKANAIRSTVAGGFENTAGGEYSAIAGGRNNIANGNYSFIGGGWENQTGGNFDTVGGGTLNKATGSRSTVSGGYGNQASNEFSAVGGGRDNVASGTNSTVSGGRFNRATATNSSVIGGLNNVASGASSVVGGESNVASGVGSVVLGSNNNAGSLNAVAIGGQNTVNGTNSAAIGSNNTVVNNDVFVLGSNTTSTQDNSVLLGNNTTDKAATAVSDTTIGDITFENFAGVSAVENGVISVGSVGAERQIVNVGAGELSATSTDAVNGSQLYSVAGTIDRLAASTVSNLGGNATLGADGTISHTNIGGTGQDTLDGAIQAANNSIKSVTGDANITATTDDDKNVIVALNKDLNVDSVTTGNTSFNTDGVRAGDVFLSSTNGLYNAGNKVTGVGDATERDDAVNYGQFQDGLNGLTKTTVDGDANITATKNATGYDVTLNQDVTLSSVTTGVTSIDNSGLKVGDVTVSTSGLDNAGNRVTSVGDAIVRDDAVNYGQFTDGLAGTIKSVTGDENIIATTDAEKNVSLVLNKDLVADSLTAGDTVINNAGFTNGATTLGNTGLKVGDVTVSNVGLDNAGNRVTSVGDATLRSDAVNYGQFTDGLAGTIKSVTGDENIIATTDAEKNVTLNLKKDILVDSMTAGNTIVNSDGMTIANTFYGSTGVRTGDVILSNTSGLYNAGYRVTGVGRAVEGMDAVNFDQFNEALNKITPTTIDGDKNITVTNKGTGYDIALNDNLTADSVTTGGTTVNNDGLTTGDVTVSSNGLSNGGNRVTNIGDAVEGSDAVSFDQFNKKFDSIVPTDIKGDENITVNKTDTGFDIGLNKDIAVDSVTVGNTSITNDGLTVGDVSVTANGLNNGGNTVKGVGDGVLRDDAVNKGQLDDLEVRQNIKNEAQDIIINNKLDRDEFLKDQERQDALLEGKADKAELEKTNANVSNNTTNINKHSDILEVHDKELGRLEDVKADKAELDKTNIKVQDNADKNKDQDKTLGDHKTELDRLEDVKADKSDLEAKADKSYVDKEITATNDRFSEINKENNAKFDKFEKSQNTIDSSQNVRIDRNEQAIADLGYKVDNLEGKLSAGIASSVAMASMPSSFIKGEARIAGGFGYYNGENAIAIGITGATETGDYSYKLGSSYTQEGGAVVGAGISYRLW